MESLTEKAVADIAGMFRDKREVLAIKPTKMFLWGPWTEEEVAQAREIVAKGA